MSTDWREVHDRAYSDGYAEGSEAVTDELVALRAERDNHKHTAAVAMETNALLHREAAALRARVAELEAALRALRDMAEASDDARYGTVGTDFVLDVVGGALRLPANKTGERT